MPTSLSQFPHRPHTPWLLLGLALAVLAAALGADRWVAWRTLDAQERQHLLIETQGVAENLGSRLQTSSDALAALRADLPWLLGQPDGLDRLNHRLAALVASTEGLRTLLVVDAQGIAFASNREALIGTDFHDQERYRTMSQDPNPDRLYVSAPFKTPLGLWAISLGRVVVDDQGHFNGYVLAIVDPAYFHLLLSTTVYAPDMRAAVIHADGLVVYRAPDPEGLTGADLHARPQSLSRRFLDSGADQAVLEGAAAGGDERLMALQTIRPGRTPADKPLVAAINRERSAVFAPWRQETWVRVGLFALIALVAAGGLSAYQRRQRADAHWRLAAEAARARDAERLRLATDGAELGAWYWDLATQIMSWSERCKVHVGLPPGQESSFDQLYQAMHPDDRPRIKALFNQAVVEGGDYATEFRVLWPDGSDHWISATGRVFTHPDGTPRGMGGITQDISARKQTEQNLRDSERRFRELFEHLPIAYQSLDSEGRWLDANQKLADLLGFDRPADLLGLNFVDYWDDRLRDQFDANYLLFKERLSIDGEVSLHRHDGQAVTVLFAGRIQRDEQGNFLRTHCILTDISERRALEEEISALNATLERKVAERTAELKAAQAQVRETLLQVSWSEERFRAMFAEAPLGIALIHSLTGRIEAVNDRFAAIAGRTREEMLTGDWMRLTHPDDVQADLDNMARLNAGEISGFQMNKRYLKPDGSVVWISMTVAALTLKPGESPRHLCMIDDISERIRLETELRLAKEAAEAATRAKSEFLAHMSHEIRTPMNAVLGLAQLLGRERLSDNQAAMVERIQTAGQSLLGIINDILDLSKIEAGQLRLEARPFDPATLLQRVDSLLAPAASAKGLALRIGPPPMSLGPVQGDALRLEQVLINLLGNAIKFTANGEVSLTVSALDSTLAAAPANLAPAATEHAVTEPAVTEHATTEPDATEHATAEADATEHATTEHATAPPQAVSPDAPSPAATVPLTTTAPPGRRLRFEVRDTGIGMSPAALASLFQPFTQADAGITRRFGGTGLGLSISQRLVALMGGAIQVASTEGQGSTFSFELTFAPAAVLEAAAPAVPASEMPTGPRLSGLHILAVDDSAMNRDLVERILTLEGARVSLAADGQQAVQRLRTPHPDIDAVLMDVQMPVMDGRSATRLIRTDLGLQDLPVIALTAGVLAEEQRAIRDAGADEVLAKPLDLEQLVATLLRLIPAPAPVLSAAAQNARPGVAATASPWDDAMTSPRVEAIPRAGGDATADPRVPPTASPRDNATTGPPIRANASTVAPASGDFPLIAGIDREHAALVTGHDRAFFLAQLARLLRYSASTVADTRLALLAGDRETATRRMHSLKGNAGNLGALALMQAAAALETAIQDQTRDLETANKEQTMDWEIASQGLAPDLDAGLTDLERQLQDLAAASAPWLAGRDARGQVGWKAAMIPAGVPLMVPGGDQPDVQAQAQALAEGQVQAQAQAEGRAQARAEGQQAAVPAGAGREGAASVSTQPLATARLAALRDALQRHDLAAHDHYEELAPALAAAWGEPETQALGEAIADLRFGAALAQLDRRVPSAAMEGAGNG